MRKLVRKLRFGVFVIAFTPTSLLAQIILQSCGIEDSIIVVTQSLFFVVQLFGAFILIKYRRDIF